MEISHGKAFKKILKARLKPPSSPELEVCESDKN